MIDFEKELAGYKFGASGDGYVTHRRRSLRLKAKSGKTAYCGPWHYDLSPNYKKGTQYSDICKECLKSYSTEEIKLLKHFLIVQKLMGK